MQNRTLRPGLLVSLKTSVTGGVQYNREEIEGEHLTEEGAKRSKWETTKTVEDAAEFDLATKVRGKCRSAIAGVCASSEFGLLCPSNREQELEDRIQAARKLAEEFNAQSKLCTVSVYVITGRIAQDDVEAVRAIGAEVKGLLDQMERGIRNGNADSIREAATKAKNLGAMLSEEAQGKVNQAIREARAAATEIVKRISKDGEAAADVVKKIRTEALDAARFAFLDLGTTEAPAQTTEAVPAALEIPAEDTTEATAEVSRTVLGDLRKLEL